MNTSNAPPPASRLLDFMILHAMLFLNSNVCPTCGAFYYDCACFETHIDSSDQLLSDFGGYDSISREISYFESSTYYQANFCPASLADFEALSAIAQDKDSFMEETNYFSPIRRLSSGEDERIFLFDEEDYIEEHLFCSKIKYDRVMCELRERCSVEKQRLVTDLLRRCDPFLLETLLRREHDRFDRSVRNRITFCERYGLNAHVYSEMLRISEPLITMLRPQGAVISGQYSHTHSLSTDVDEVLEGVMTQLNDIADKMHVSTTNLAMGATHVTDKIGAVATNVQMYLGIALLLVAVTLACLCAHKDHGMNLALIVPLSVVGGVIGTMLAARVDLGSLASDITAWFAKPPVSGGIVLQATPLEETSEIGRMLCEVASICFFSTRVKYDSGVDSLLRTLNTAENDSRTLGNIFTRVSDVVLRIVEKICHAVGCEVSLTVQSGFMHAFKEIEGEINQLMTEVESSEYVTHVHEAKLQGLIDNITSLLVKMPAKTENNVVRSKLNTTLTIVKSTLMQVKLRLQALAGARFETFCLNLVGTPGCGKTTLLYKMMYRFLALIATDEELKRLDEITKQPVNVIGNSTKYFEGFDPRLWITVINEIFQGKEPKDATAFSRLLIDMLGGNKCPLPMAAIDKKGVTNFEARMMLCAGNNLSLPLLNGLESVGQDALMRRMDACCWRMIVTREFAKLDAAGSPVLQGSIPPGMSENVYGYMLDTDKAHALPLIDGEPNMTPFRMIKWNYATAAPRSEKQYTVDEFFTELKQQYTYHCLKQRRLLNTTETSRNAFIARMAPPILAPLVAQAKTDREDDEYDSTLECDEPDILVERISSELMSVETICPLRPLQHYQCGSYGYRGQDPYVNRLMSDCTCSTALKRLWIDCAISFNMADFMTIVDHALPSEEDIELHLQAGSVTVAQENLSEVFRYSEVDYANYTRTMDELKQKAKIKSERDKDDGIMLACSLAREDHSLLRTDPTFHEKFCSFIQEYVTEPVSTFYSTSLSACQDAYLSSLAVVSAYMRELTASFEEAKHKWWLWMVDHPLLTWFGVTAAGVFTGGIVYTAICAIIEKLSCSNIPNPSAPVVTETLFAFPDPVVEQAKVTSGMDNVRVAVARNSYVIKLTSMSSSGRGTSRTGHALFAKGRSFITNTHTWSCKDIPGFNDTPEGVLVEIFLLATEVPFYSFYKKHAMVRADYEINDITIVTCPIGVREHKDITCYMLKPDDYDAVKCIRSENLVGCMLGANGNYRSGLFHYTGPQMLPSPSRAVVKHSLGVSMATADGECGLPILVSSPTLTRLGKTEMVLTGIHFAKREHSEFGLSNVLTSNIFEGLPLSSSVGGLEDILTLQSYSRKIGELSVAHHSERAFIPIDDNVPFLQQRVVGEIVPSFTNVTVSDYGRAPLYKVVNDELKTLGCDVLALKRPVDLRDKPGDVPLTVASITGYGQNKHQLHDPALLQEIVTVVASNMSESLHHQESRDVGILDYDQIINTGELQDLDLTKASGPITKTIHGIERKVLFPDRDMSSPVALEFFQFMKDYENSIADGCNLVHVSTQSLKSELRPQHKLIPRTFFMQELPYHLLAKKFLGQFVNDAPKLGLHVAVGMNTYQEAPNLYHEFSTEHTIVGDHEKFDKYQLAQVTMCLDVIVEAYYRGTAHDNSRSRSIRYKLLYSLVHWYAIVTAGGRSYVVEVDGAMPSGDLRTAVFNSLYNYIATLYVMCRQYQSRFPDLRSISRDTIRRLIRGLRARFYGDDFLLSVHQLPDFHWFTFFHLKKGFAEEFGTVLTTSRKDGIEAPYQKLEEEMWLGRHFKMVDGEPVLALKLASIFGCLYFKRKSVTTDEYRQMVENSLMELSLHGRGIFDSLAHKIQSAYHADCGGVLVNTQYETARLNCRSRVNEY